MNPVLQYLVPIPAEFYNCVVLVAGLFALLGLAAYLTGFIGAAITDWLAA